MAVLIFIVGLVLFTALAPDFLVHGDAAVYARQIAQNNFSERTVHLGYFLIGSVLKLFNGNVSDRGLNLLSCVFGAGSLVLIFLLSRQLSAGRTAALFASATMAVHWVFVENTLYAEVYGSQTFFLVLAFYVWTKKQALAAGPAFAISALITPSTALAGPSFLIYRPNVRSWVRAFLPAALLMSLFLSPVLDDYLLGPRGLLNAVPGFLIGAPAPSLPKTQSIEAADAVEEPDSRCGDLCLGIRKEARDVVLGCLHLLPLWIVGLGALLRRKALQRFALALFSLWLLSFLFGIGHPTVPVQLPTYVLSAVVAAFGFEHLVTADRGASMAVKMTLLAFVSISASFPLGILWWARPRFELLQGLPSTLPIFLALALWGGTVACAGGMLAGRAGLRWMPWLLVLLNAVFVISMATDKTREAEGFRQTVVEIDRVAEPGFLVIATWDKGILFSHYVGAESYGDHWLSPAWLKEYWGEEKRKQSEGLISRATARGRQIWLLGDYPEVEQALEAKGYGVSTFHGAWLAQPIHARDGF